MSGSSRSGKRLVVMLVVAVVAAQLAVATVMVSTLGENKDSASTAQRNADQARELSRQIQQERSRFIRSSCESQNQRHDATIKTLNKLVAAASGQRKRRLVASRPGTTLLIKALVPKRDCDEVVRRAVRGGE